MSRERQAVSPHPLSRQIKILPDFVDTGPHMIRMLGIGQCQQIPGSLYRKFFAVMGKHQTVPLGQIIIKDICQGYGMFTADFRMLRRYSGPFFVQICCFYPAEQNRNLFFDLMIAANRQNPEANDYITGGSHTKSDQGSKKKKVHDIPWQAFFRVRWRYMLKVMFRVFSLEPLLSITRLARRFFSSMGIWA